MKVRVRVEVEVARGPADVYDIAVFGFPRLLRAAGPIPGIAKAEMVDGASVEPGRRRLVTMTDGSLVLEEILDAERPRRHRYRWVHPPAFPFSLLVRRGEADWTFSPSRAGTRVTWTYALELTTPLAYPLALPMLAFFRRWMALGLSRLRGAAET